MRGVSVGFPTKPVKRPSTFFLLLLFFLVIAIEARGAIFHNDKARAHAIIRKHERDPVHRT